MAHHASAKKRHRQSLERQARNKHWRSRVRNAVRAARTSLVAGADDAGERLQRAETLLRKAGTRGVLPARTVSRTVSRLRQQQRRTAQPTTSG